MVAVKNRIEYWQKGFSIDYGLGFIYKKFSGSFLTRDLGGFFLDAKGTNVTLTFGYNLYTEIGGDLQF